MGRLPVVALPHDYLLRDLDKEPWMRRAFLTGWVFASALGCAGRQTSTSEAAAAGPSAAERVVQAQLEAYNRHDLDAFAATYAPEVRGYRYPDRPVFTGLAELRSTYGQFFASAPAVRARVVRRIVHGNFVIDHEEVTGMPDGQTLRAVAIYEVRDGRIASVRFIQ